MMAMRMLQDLGCNEADSELEQESLEGKQWLYLFWIAFMMDTAMSLRANRSTTQRLADISVPLPNARSLDWCALNLSNDHCTTWKVNILTLNSSLALIQAECADELFSASARRRPASLITGTFNGIISKLDAWKKSNPLFGVDTPSMIARVYQSDIVHTVILEASYFETLYRLHASKILAALAIVWTCFPIVVLKPHPIASALIYSMIHNDWWKWQV